MMIDMKTKKMTKGFTLLELATVIAILGILAGAMVTGFSSHVRSARSQAAVQGLQSLADLLRSRPGPPIACAASPTVVPKGTVVKWVPSPGFKMLGWRPGGDTRFQFEVTVPGPKGAAFEVIARGDLDGDGQLSIFRLSADGHEPTIERPTE